MDKRQLAEYIAKHLALGTTKQDFKGKGYALTTAELVPGTPDISVEVDGKSFLIVVQGP